MNGVVRSSVYLDRDALERECRFERLRRSGPGGQNRNKVETGVRFWHVPTGLLGEATERRYQGENRRIALERLRIELALNVRAVPKLETNEEGALELAREERVGFRWFSRAVGGKLRVSSEHFDYPILTAEFFDVYEATGEDLSLTSRVLGVTPSQIVRFLSAVPKALEHLNSLRAANGLGRLRP